MEDTNSMSSKIKLKKCERQKKMEKNKNDQEQNKKKWTLRFCLLRKFSAILVLVVSAMVLPLSIVKFIFCSLYRQYFLILFFSLLFFLCVSFYFNSILALFDVSFQMHSMLLIVTKFVEKRNENFHSYDRVTGSIIVRK